MVIIIPVSAHDTHLLDGQVQCLLKHEGLLDHSIVMMPAASQQQAATKAAATLMSVCPDVQIHALRNDPPGGWPMAPNVHWFEAARYMSTHPKQQPWLWLENDARPMCRGWQTKLMMEYAASGKPFMMALKPVREPDGKGGFINRTADLMGSGVGMYPWNYYSESLCIHDLINPNLRDPFNLHLRTEMEGFGRSDTKLICDTWRTQNFRYASDPSEPLPAGRTGWLSYDPAPQEAGQPSSVGGFVNPEAVLVHGCKDDSLTDISLGRHPMFIPGHRPIEEKQNTALPHLISQAQLEKEIEESKKPPLAEKNLSIPDGIGFVRQDDKSGADVVGGKWVDTYDGKTAKEWYCEYKKSIDEKFRDSFAGILLSHSHLSADKINKIVSEVTCLSKGSDSAHHKDEYKLRFSKLVEHLAILGRDEFWKRDPYHHGWYNGFAQAYDIMNDTKEGNKNIRMMKYDEPYITLDPNIYSDELNGEGSARQIPTDGHGIEVPCQPNPVEIKPHPDFVDMVKDAGHYSITIEDIRFQLKGKKVRLPKLIEALNSTEEAVVSLINTVGSKVVIGPGGLKWVSLVK